MGGGGGGGVSRKLPKGWRFWMNFHRRRRRSRKIGKIKFSVENNFRVKSESDSGGGGSKSRTNVNYIIYKLVAPNSEGREVNIWNFCVRLRFRRRAGEKVGASVILRRSFRPQFSVAGGGGTGRGCEEGRTVEGEKPRGIPWDKRFPAVASLITSATDKFFATSTTNFASLTNYSANDDFSNELCSQVA